MIVFRSDYNKAVRPNDRITPFGKPVLDLLTVVVVRQVKIANIKKLCFNVITLAHLAANPIRNISALAVFARRAEQCRNKEFGICHHN